MGTRAEQIRKLPKADLHMHLDGAARPETLWELGQERQIPYPAGGAAALRQALTWQQGFSIQDCLQTFDLVTSVLQDGPALRRVAREVVEDAAADGCTHLEVRYAPTLSTRGHLSAAEVVEATLAGFADAGAVTGISPGLILCCWRAMEAHEANEIADLAIAYADRGVVGIDIVDVAGPEAVQDIARFRSAYERVGRAGLGRTCHAGEIGGPQSVRAAIEMLGVDRIGHGVAAVQDSSVVELIRKKRITVEICLSSNLYTGTVPNLRAHPFGQLYRAGLPVVLCTDDPTMENTTLTREYQMAAEAFHLDDEDLGALAETSLSSLFKSPANQVPPL